VTNNKIPINHARGLSKLFKNSLAELFHIIIFTYDALKSWRLFE